MTHMTNVRRPDGRNSLFDVPSKETLLCAAPGPGKQAYVLMLLGSLLLPGCAQLSSYSIDNGHNGEGREQLTGVDIHSSYPAVRRDSFEKINVLELIDPNNERKPMVDQAKRSNHDKEPFISIEYDFAFAAFRMRPDTFDNPKHVHRNAVQDRMLSVSTSRCNVFKTYLRRQQSDSNFLLGSLTTASGVLGAVLPGANASRNLAGAAGFFSGVQAEYNSAYFSNLAAHVIIQGIEARQKRMLDELITRRTNLTIEQYSMEAAVRDAIYFDGSCSTIVGLQEAGDAIKDVTNPGLSRAAEVIAQAKVVRKILDAENIQELKRNGELDELLKQSQPKTAELVVSAANNAPPHWAIGDQIVRSTNLSLEIEEVIKKVSWEVQASYDASYARLSEDKKKENPQFKQLGVAWEAKLRSLDLGKQLKLNHCTDKVISYTKAWSQAKAAQITVSGDNPAERIRSDGELASSEAKVIASVSLARHASGVATTYIRELTQMLLRSDEIKQAQAKDVLEKKIHAVGVSAEQVVPSLALKAGCKPE